MDTRTKTRYEDEP